MPLHPSAPTAHTPAPGLPAGLPLLDRDAAAALACVSASTVQRWRTAGALPLVRIGARVLYRRTTVLAYLAALTAPSDGTAAATLPAPARPSPDAAAELLTVEAVRAALAVGSTTVTELLRTGELPSVRVHTRRLIRAGALATFVDSHSVAATTGPLAGRLA